MTLFKSSYAIQKYEEGPNIIKIKSSLKPRRLFDFNFVTSDNISKIVTSLNPAKKTSDLLN